MPPADDRFTGRIAGVGTRLAGSGAPDRADGAPGPRFVVGMWAESPLGRFCDVMVETPAGRRILLAPRDDVADYVSGTYTFDEVRVMPVSWRKIDGGLGVTAGDVLDLRLGIGAITPLGMLLRAVPRPLATSPAWLTAIDPVARLLVPGAATAGSAGGGRREFYGVTLARRITSLTGTVVLTHGTAAQELTGPAPLAPPVRFGFASAPAAPTLVDVTTTIRTPRARPE
ncbi:hypothetical protein [Frondihabitans australicus]|uniref:Uncharacterized protein n=1 Tax=Frondihabitans australicus TaxID=386892 RepID=A0A495IMK8_9MICO|nr:hypothetical protein [Frondihabitans australicus]RKR76678.1 hypothetical protein C8E83_3855 [Frondihabitans australicus]